MKIINYIFLCVFISSCANTDVYRGDVYDSNQAKTERSVRYGVIVSAFPVKIQAKTTIVGSAVGATIGGALASYIGRDKHGKRDYGWGLNTQTIASVAGATVGGIVGNKIEEKVNQVMSLELTIKTDNGENIVVVQKNQPNLTVGSRVRIVGNGSSVNVNPM